MAEPTLDDLVAFMKKHGAERVDSITDEESAIKHFRATSRVYKEERDSFRKQRDELIQDIAKLREQSEDKEMDNTLEIKLLSENATMPKRDRLDAGFDIFAAETVILEPQEKAVINTDIAVNIPEGYVGLLTSRSGVSSKTHLVIETGKIDAGFQGNMGINIKNDRQDFVIDSDVYQDIAGEIHYTDKTLDAGTYQINKGDKLAQLVIVPIWTPELKEVEEFSYVSERGTDGFGSTGY